MDIRDFLERLTRHNTLNPPRKPRVYLQEVIPPPPGSPDYMAMNPMVMGIPKPLLPEIRSLLMEKRKVPIGWPACLKRSPPKAAFNNNDIYGRNSTNNENLYEEPQERKTDEEEGQEPKEKNMKVFL